MTPLRFLLPALLVLGACKRPPEAPKQLDDLSQYLYAEWDNEDPEVLAVGLANLRLQLEKIEMDSGNVNDRSWELSPIAANVAAEVDGPDEDPADTLGVAVARESVWPVSDHARLQAEPDQVIAEPSAKNYARSFPNKEDVCFPDMECEVMVTTNVVNRENLVMSVTGDLYKDFRWVELEDGSMAFMSRSWIPEPWIGDSEKSKVWQSYSIDVFLPQGKDKTWRYQTLWSESEVANASDTVIIGTVKGSTDNIFKAGDDAIEELYH